MPTTVTHSSLTGSALHVSKTPLNDANGNAGVKANAAASAVNWLDVNNSATGQPVSIQPGGIDTDISIEVKAKGAGRVKLNGMSSSAADPSTTELPTSGDIGVHKNTTSGNVFLAVNDGGAIKKVQLT